LTASGGITSSTGNFTTGGNITASTGGKMQSAYYDALADTAANTTALSIGSNVVAGNIVIGNSQTTGDIIIGASDASGATITVGTSSTATTINGSVNTANQLTATGGIKTNAIDSIITNSDTLYIGSGATGGGGQIIIGNNKTAGYIAIGATNTSSSVIINPYLDINTGIRIYNASGIQLTTTTYTPSAFQLGYTTTGSFAATTTTAIITTGFNLVATSNLQIGIYWITFSSTFDTFSATTGMFLAHNFTVVGCGQTIQAPQTTGSLNVSGVIMSGVLTVTSTTNSCTYRPNTSTGTCRSTGSGYTLIRIA
jgi:hypothetical protein